MIGKERAELVGTVGQRQEHVGDEARLLLYRQNTSADIFWQLVEGGRRKSLCNWLRHRMVPAWPRVRRSTWVNIALFCRDTCLRTWSGSGGFAQEKLREFRSLAQRLLQQRETIGIE